MCSCALRHTITDRGFDFRRSASQARNVQIGDGGTMNRLMCDECGTSFNCGVAPGKERCWCMSLPNLRGSFDLAGSCVCPDCLTLGKAKDITKMRKMKKRQRANASLRTKN